MGTCIQISTNFRATQALNSKLVTLELRKILLSVLLAADNTECTRASISARQPVRVEPLKMTAV